MSLLVSCMRCAGTQTTGTESARAQTDANSGASQQGQQDSVGQSATADGAKGGAPPTPTQHTKNIIILSTATKAVYVHFANHIATWYWMKTDFHPWLFFWAIVIVGGQLLVRYRIAKMSTAQQAKLGETMLDQRTRDLLSDIEQLRTKDPLRMEHEANSFHEQFWARRAKAVQSAHEQRRTIEMQRGLMQGEARGTDMTEWLGAKAKDEDEREVARRTHDYIQGFHQHLKSKRLI